MDYKYHYFYRITNLINGHFYYGIHSTNNLEDGYMGSGHRLKEAVKMYGKENFVKEILKYFETRESASVYEESVVTEELVHSSNCYNIKIGGDYGTTVGTILVTDKDGKWLRCTPDDPRYLNGELVHFMKNKVSVFDKIDKKYKIISCTDYSLNKERYLTYSNGFVTVKDKYENYYNVSVNDPRYLNGELKHVWCGRKHSEGTKQKMKNTKRITGSQKGEKNSQYGTCWIIRNGQSMKIKKNEIEKYISEGWKKGRKINRKGE